MNEMINDSVSVDQGNASNESVTDGMTAEEMFELQHGKNSDGTPITKKVSKADLIALAQKGFGANQSFEEAKALKQQVTELAKLMADPEKVFDILQQLGHDPDQLFMGRWNKQTLENMKTPQEKEFEIMKRDAELYRKQTAERQEREQAQLIQERAQAVQTTLLGKIEQALSDSGVDKSKQTVAEVARYIQLLAQQQGEKFNLDNVPVEQIVKHLKQSRQSRFGSLLDELDEDGILGMLTPAQRQKIGAALTKSLQTQGMQPVRQPTSHSQSQQPKKKYISFDESMGGRNRFK